MHHITKYLTICIIALNILLYGCTRGNPNLIESTGTIEATEVDIRSEASGKILTLYFDEGDWVKQGDVIAEIDHVKLDIELARAKANWQRLKRS